MQEDTQKFIYIGKTNPSYTHGKSYKNLGQISDKNQKVISIELSDNSDRGRQSWPMHLLYSNFKPEV